MKTDTAIVTARSEALFARALRLMPGGVNSPVRAFRAVGGTPRFIREGRGARVWDEDGHELIDFVGSWGPMILGHAHPAVVAALTRQLSTRPRRSPGSGCAAENSAPRETSASVLSEKTKTTWRMPALSVPSRCVFATSRCSVGAAGANVKVPGPS